jgi:hypothetical protein
MVTGSVDRAFPRRSKSTGSATRWFPTDTERVLVAAALLSATCVVSPTGMRETDRWRPTAPGGRSWDGADAVIPHRDVGDRGGVPRPWTLSNPTKTSVSSTIRRDLTGVGGRFDPTPADTPCPRCRHQASIGPWPLIGWCPPCIPVPTACRGLPSVRRTLPIAESTETGVWNGPRRVRVGEPRSTSS